ncbi:MAG: hypothetical protein KJ811_04155, partial [Candidatus Margulisbacteria bacterium]|nr:hypothetical protein [Candidatus Margulisiibacteriota bacterium]
MFTQTPMMKQYLSIKEKHQDAILFFRLGDFYEMFFEDAQKASQELDLVLTGRGKDENRMPMCGIPFHASQNYIAKLIGKGYKVAICEQVEDPKDAQGIVKREVIKIVTPGTVLESNLLSDKSNNYLLAITKEKNNLVAFNDPVSKKVAVVSLSSATMDKLKTHFGENDFYERKDGITRLDNKAEAFVGGWFGDIAYKREFFKADSNNDGKLD